MHLWKPTALNAENNSLFFSQKETRTTLQDAVPKVALAPEGEGGQTGDGSKVGSAPPSYTA